MIKIFKTASGNLLRMSDGKIFRYDISDFTGIKYGALYNWYAAADSRKITSSDDWVVPTVSQYSTLWTSCGGELVASDKIRETGTTYWDAENGATNITNFNGRGSGSRTYDTGVFTSLKSSCGLWKKDDFDSQIAFAASFNSTQDRVNNGSNYKQQGYSLRLLYTGAGTPSSYTGNDGKVYQTVTINGVTYLAENLAETKFRNGDWITGYDGGTYTPISNVDWAAKTTEAMCIYGDVESNMLL